MAHGAVAVHTTTPPPLRLGGERGPSSKVRAAETERYLRHSGAATSAHEPLPMLHVGRGPEREPRQRTMTPSVPPDLSLSSLAIPRPAFRASSPVPTCRQGGRRKRGISLTRYLAPEQGRRVRGEGWSRAQALDILAARQTGGRGSPSVPVLQDFK